jgi:hydrogenase/urease accessory protein HupE
MKRLLAIIAIVAGPAASFAHPGHGHENPLSPGHYLGNPEHALPVLLTISVATLFIVWKVKRARRNAGK